MIAAINGKIISLSPGTVEIETAAGIVFSLLIPVSDYSGLQGIDQANLYTLLRIKDDHLVLYGFVHKSQRKMFEKLTAVSGVGGKTALSIISAFSSDELIQAIDGGDLVKLSSIPGIGKKTAQRLVLELTGKLEFADQPKNVQVQLKEDVISAVINLGYPQKGVADAVNALMRENPNIDSFEELFKLILKKISRL
jgi:Holliday junction DNA helicase RuvA